MSPKIEKGRIGQSFDTFLRDEGRHEESTAQAIKCVLAYQLATVMHDQHITKVWRRDCRPAALSWIDYFIRRKPVSHWNH